MPQLHVLVPLDMTIPVRLSLQVIRGQRFGFSTFSVTGIATWPPKSTYKSVLDFPSGIVVKNPPANVRDTGSSPGPGRSHMPQSN